MLRRLGVDADRVRIGGALHVRVGRYAKTYFGMPGRVESHLLHQDVLDHLHIVCNYEWDSAPLLSLILVGLPELRDRMELRRNRSLWSRIHVRLDLADPLPEDTVEYVHHRLKAAGGDQELFSSDALAILHEASGGHLRSVDRIATHALKTAARRKLKRVDRELVQHIAQES